MLHLAARVALRLWPPLVAKRHIDALGALFGPFDVDEGERVASGLRGGTCLSRSLVLAARIPRAEVIIGTARRPDTRLHAHAWVEIEGRAIGRGEQTTEMARLK
jgi:hypothetical protein